ncbi:MULTISPECIES: GNAT family N-acetyltransferase [Pseudomonas syringae group]|uniref:GNAT family N-acetyltransferase n=1 Tax=Pseudomonas syringae group TaxID=136849 RepID=UPI001D053A7B|nr:MULTISPECIES: GNAT family N-acetyltransferase [Pseudomonas syringae group]MCI3911813.1 GNAT family N-acetyltransferase [Pseudomonas viridiflava]MCK9730315.1 GNAT family N-acetyltransferase [Pseudomonas syringae pv. syringae]
MGKEMVIQATEIGEGQRQRFRDALKSADLPADDIDLPGRTFYEFRQDSETVAWGGFETHGTDGLLRSLVVVSTCRSKDVGVAVLRVMEAIAADKGIARFHLLTTTASGFFERQGSGLCSKSTRLSATSDFSNGAVQGALPWLGLLYEQSPLLQRRDDYAAG